jgi:TPR repeat protein
MKKIVATLVILFATTTFEVQSSNTQPLLDFVKNNADEIALYVKRSRPQVNQSKGNNKKNKPTKKDLSSEELAFITIKESAENGYTPAQDLLAYCYATGAGTKIDKILAFCWYLQAAFNGSHSAKESLITCFDQGIGVAKNAEIAKFLRMTLPMA